MPRLKPLVLLPLAFTLTAATRAQDDHMRVRGGRAETLVKDCRAVLEIDPDRMTAPARKQSDIGYCLGYLTGLSDMGDAVALAGAKQSRFFCLPLTASGLELAKVIVKYGDDHPEKLHDPAIVFAASIFAADYPCPK